MTHNQTTWPICITLRADKKMALPAEIGALTPVFEKSATELKLKQKLLKCKSAIQIATFEVITLNRMSQLAKLTVSVRDHDIDIICIYKNTDTFIAKILSTGNGWTFVSASTEKSSVNATIGSVGMLIGPQALKSLHTTEDDSRYIQWQPQRNNYLLLQP